MLTWLSVPSSRDERRFIERQNKAARKERKKAETARLRQLVDSAYAVDPRVQRFKDEDRDKKAAQKQRKQEERQRRIDEEDQVSGCRETYQAPCIG